MRKKEALTDLANELVKKTPNPQVVRRCADVLGYSEKTDVVAIMARVLKDLEKLQRRPSEVAT